MNRPTQILVLFLAFIAVGIPILLVSVGTYQYAADRKGRTLTRRLLRYLCIMQLRDPNSEADMEKVVRLLFFQAMGFGVLFLAVIFVRTWKLIAGP